MISSYVLANRQTARNGALLALLSSLIQALVAIALVAVLALVFDATAAVMNQATRWLELASYALVTLLGVWLVWLKALRPLLRRADARRTAPPAVQALAAFPPKCAAALRAIAVRVSAPGGQGHATTHHHEPDHVHHEDCGCGHAHAPAAEQVAGPMNWRRAVSAILAVGLRPCSGALIVLVFSLSQGFFAAGIASALAMGLGRG